MMTSQEVREETGDGAAGGAAKARGGEGLPERCITHETMNPAERT